MSGVRRPGREGGGGGEGWWLDGWWWWWWGPRQAFKEWQLTPRACNVIIPTVDGFPTSNVKSYMTYDAGSLGNTLLVYSSSGKKEDVESGEGERGRRAMAKGARR